jgi:hypothetical protein
MNVNPASVPIPPGVVTATLPEAPIPTVAVILVAELTVKELAATPPNVTAVAPVKLVPEIVTVPPTMADAGEKEVTTGAGIKINPTREPLPNELVIDTLPEAPGPTTAVIVVLFTTVKEPAAMPPNVTAVDPVKFVPDIVTVVPCPALVGAKDVMIGTGRNINPPKEPVPNGLVTDTLPEAPGPTTAVIVVLFTIVKELAAMPPNDTAVDPIKFVPVIVTVVPVPALVGLKEVIIGGAAKIKPDKDPEPNALVTSTSPEAPVPTVALITFAFTTPKLDAETPPNFTAVAPVKNDPKIVTPVPVPPDAGLKDETIGEPQVFLNTEIFSRVNSDSIRSVLPSPSRSPIITP